MGNWENF
jgi:serine/threonine-protein kinase mTOR